MTATRDAVSVLMAHRHRISLRYPRPGEPASPVPARMSDSGQQVNARLTWYLDGKPATPGQLIEAAARLGPPGATYTQSEELV